MQKNCSLRPFAGDLYQYTAPPTQFMDKSDFEDNGNTAVYWLSAAGVMINAHGVVILVDPVITVKAWEPVAISETGAELMTLPPISAEDVPKVDAVLYTHADDDHMGPMSLKLLAEKGTVFYGTEFTCSKMEEAGIAQESCVRVKPKDIFSIGDTEITVTPADHVGQFEFRFEDCCGYRVHTDDGTVYIPGDTVFLYDLIRYKDVDLSFIDFGTCESHLGKDGAVRLFNGLEKADFIAYHLGTFYGPTETWNNGDPNSAADMLNDINRLKLLAPGQKYILHKK